MNDIIKKEKEWINNTWDKIERKLSQVCIRSREKLPYTVIDGVHDSHVDNEATYWTNGFWGGMMWLMYATTKNEEYKKTAMRSEELMDRALEDYDLLHHDVGFMWHILSGAGYRLTDDKKSRARNLYAAATLFSRYNVDGGYIRAWNDVEAEGWTIVDTFMNLPLLYWASKELNDDRFKKIAMKHADMAIRDHINPDGSVNHIVEHNINTGEVVKVYCGQGYELGSCWSRGLAWALYGTVLSYVHTGKKDYLDAAIKTANYFIVHTAENDYLTPIDFKAPSEPRYYDSSAGVCAACGLIELSKNVSEAEANSYIKAAISILKAIDENFCDYAEGSDAIVMMGSELYPHTEQEIKNRIHKSMIYSDFFYVEALTKLKGLDFLIW